MKIMEDIEFNITEFKPSCITVIEDSEITLHILFRLCIDSIISLDKDVLYIDGLNSFNPYIIQKMLKPLKVDQRKILSRIHIARAFTEYQMDTLIKGLNSAIKEWNAGVLIISYLPSLFYSSNKYNSNKSKYNNRKNNKKRLLESSIKQLKSITTSSEIITIMTSLGDSPEDKLLASKADRIIRIEKTKEKAKNIIRIIDDGHVSEHVPIASGQTRFSDF